MFEKSQICIMYNISNKINQSWCTNSTKQLYVEMNDLINILLEQNMEYWKHMRNDIMKSLLKKCSLNQPIRYQ